MPFETINGPGNNKRQVNLNLPLEVFTLHGLSTDVHVTHHLHCIFLFFIRVLCTLLELRCHQSCIYSICCA